jgi:hypothetical protein
MSYVEVLIFLCTSCDSYTWLWYDTRLKYVWFGTWLRYILDTWLIKVYSCIGLWHDYYGSSLSCGCMVKVYTWCMVEYAWGTCFGSLRHFINDMAHVYTWLMLWYMVLVLYVIDSLVHSTWLDTWLMLWLEYLLVYDWCMLYYIYWYIVDGWYGIGLFYGTITFWWYRDNYRLMVQLQVIGWCDRGSDSDNDSDNDNYSDNDSDSGSDFGIDSWSTLIF